MDNPMVLVIALPLAVALVNLVCLPSCGSSSSCRPRRRPRPRRASSTLRPDLSLLGAVVLSLDKLGSALAFIHISA
jgi:hypothetical protein